MHVGRGACFLGSNYRKYALNIVTKISLYKIADQQDDAVYTLHMELAII
jgi:hypothetical protein